MRACQSCGRAVWTYGRLLLAAGLLGSAAAIASEDASLNGAALLTECEADSMFCNGFIIGVLAGSAVIEVGKTTPRHTYGSLRWCDPKGLEYLQIRLVVLKYLKDNPANLHYVPESLIASAMSK